MTYTAREELKPSGLNGITDDQINDHWNLYKGYIAQSNALKDQLETMRESGQGGTPEYMDRRRRFGFEFNGMVLHEYYFGNLTAGVNLDENAGFAKTVSEKFGSLDAWKEDFAAAGKSRSIGWAICYMDPQTGDINNHFIQLHEEGNIAGYNPLVVMDVWEHAYMVDHKAGGRPDYIHAFLSNVNWDVVEKRFVESASKEVSKRFAA
jgi:Fe-Mn family superoxide dismutase